MKSIIRATLVFLILIGPAISARSDEKSEHADEPPKKMAGKAISETKNDGQMFRLSPEAEAVLKLKFERVSKGNGPGQYLVPTAGLVEYQDSTGVYVREDGWYSLIEVSLVKSTGTLSLVTSKSLQLQTQIATSNLGLLRAAHLEASGQGGEGHAD